MESVKLTDEQSKAVQKTPNRVALADLEANIAAEYSFIGADILGDAPVMDSLKVLTLCILVTKNGFTIIGKAAPADADNFNPELGKKFAREDAIRQLWPLMGYALREKLANPA